MPVGAYLPRKLCGMLAFHADNPYFDGSPMSFRGQSNRGAAMSSPGVSETNQFGGMDLNSPVPPPPDDAPAEQHEEHWYRHVYQGDRVKQLSFRAVMMGGIIGMMMSVAGLYTTLKIGWSFGVAITSCVISYVLWNTIRSASGKRVSQMTILENNCMASTASAAGYSTGATIATAFGALLLLEKGEDSKLIETFAVQSPWVVGGFTLVTGALGVFLAIPMKRQMINKERLPFPSGIAAATTLKSLYSEGKEAAQKAYALIIALACGAFVGVLNTGEGGLKFLDKTFEWMREKAFNIHLPELVPAQGFAMLHGKQRLAFGFEPSVLLVAAGMIVGLRVSLSMLVGSLLLYLWVGPMLVEQDMAHAADPNYVRSIDIIAGGTIFHFPRWALWGGTALMVFASLTALALQWKTVLRSFGIGKPKVAHGTVDAELEKKIASIEVPNSWLIAGLVPIGIATVIVNYLAFQMDIYLGIIAVVLSFVLSMVACRATGETDTTPIGAMGKVMQLLFAVLPGAKGNITVNLMSASIAANAASSSADLLTDLKSGYVLGANPRKQFIAQFIGIFFGTIAIVPAWYLLVPNKAALEAFNPPATNMWKAVAEVLAGEKGLNGLPESAKFAILIGALVGIVLPVIEKVLPKARPFLPSAMGLGLSWVVGFNNSLAFAIGAVIAWMWLKSSPKTEDKFRIPIASGLVAGESLMKAALAMLATASGLFKWNL